MEFVVGATGVVGGEICRLLRDRGAEVRGLVRKRSAPDRVRRLEELGVNLVEGDLTDAGWMEEACRGVETLFTTASYLPLAKDEGSVDTVDRDGQARLVEAASSAGVRNVVFTSFMRYDDVAFPLGKAKESAERAIAASGMHYTILQSTFFDEVWLTPVVGFDWANGAVRVYGDGEQTVAFVSAADVAAYAVASVGNPRAMDRIVEVGGPDALTPHRVVSIFEAATGSSIGVEHVPEAALRQQLEAAGDPVTASFAGLMINLARGDGIEPEAVRRVFPDMHPTSVEDYAARVARA